MDKYKNEVLMRYGDTDAYREFEDKTQGLTEADFRDCAEGLSSVFAEFALCKAQGNTPDSPQAQAIVLKLRNFITQHFYTCTNEILRGLGVMYTADERFRQNIDKNGIGTAEFASKAIGIYCG